MASGTRAGCRSWNGVRFVPEPELKPTLDVEAPVQVTIEIKGECLDDTLYAMDIIRERIMDNPGRPEESKVRVNGEESYRYKVVQLDQVLTRNQEIQLIYQTLLAGREIWLDPDDALQMARELYSTGFRKSDG